MTYEVTGLSQGSKGLPSLAYGCLC